LSAIIEFRGIEKRFPGVKALDGVSFSIEEGEIHAIVGENGAGKSTLMNILGGQYHPDGGEIRYKGKAVRIHSQYEALRLGIGVVYQEVRLCPNLTVAENLFLGREREAGKGRVDWPLMRSRAGEILAALGSSISPDRRVSALSIANQQIVEIARALSLEAEVVIMDEPTSALTLKETEGLFERVRGLKARGVTIIYISHRLEEVFALCDRISVLRDGRYFGTHGIGDIDPKGVIELIAGRDLGGLGGAAKAAPSPEGRKVALQLTGLSRTGRFDDVSLKLYEGEILGVYGLQGSGRTELLEAVFGLEPPSSGTMSAFGAPVRNRNPAEAIRNGFAMIPENRRDAGIFPEMDILENINTANPRDMSGFGGLLRRGFMARLAEESVRALDIKTDTPRRKVRNLSGGNQQKVVISKWLAAHPRILLVDELTRGIDVGAKDEIYRILKKLRDAGLSILMVSSELAEVVSESDRILIMKNGSLVAQLSGEERTREQVIKYAL
jgi:ABC-type sugar transport system ATPase subunit